MSGWSNTDLLRYLLLLMGEGGLVAMLYDVVAPLENITAICNCNVHSCHGTTLYTHNASCSSLDLRRGLEVEVIQRYNNCTPKAANEESCGSLTLCFLGNSLVLIWGFTLTPGWDLVSKFKVSEDWLLHSYPQPCSIPGSWYNKAPMPNL